MKNFLLFIGLFFSIHAFSQSTPVVSASNSEVENNKMKVFLAITHNDDAVSSNMRTSLGSMNGVTILAYCNKHALFMVTVDKNSFQDESSFLEYVKKYNSNYATLLTTKQGDFDAFLKECDPANASDASRIKNLSSN